jgi:hypothetical protein
MTGASAARGTKERSAQQKLVIAPSNPNITHSLHKLLCKLAVPLLGVGITPRQFSEIAANAFVKAACNASTLRNGRVNQSRVAVLTGLSRPEVRKALRAAGFPRVTTRQRPRTLRVIDGWQSDSRFLDSEGRPRELRLKGTRASFTTLTRKYAGDVPYRAVLDELQRMKVVRISQGCVRLLSGSVSSSVALLRLLSSLLPLVGDSISEASEDRSESRPTIQHLTLKAADGRDLKVMRERVMLGATTFLTGLDRSLHSPTTPHRSPRKNGHQLRISILVR